MQGARLASGGVRRDFLDHLAGSWPKRNKCALFHRSDPGGGVRLDGMRIATWNLERPSARQIEKIGALQKQMSSVEADIWILTETNSCVSPGQEYKWQRSSTPIAGPERYEEGENRTTIWSRLPISDSAIETHDPETAVCAEVEHAGKLILIYGTIIPYQHAGTKYPYRFEGKNVVGRKGWELHYESIGNHSLDWQRLRGRFPDHQMVVAGDLNQNRGGRHVYGTKKGRDLLGFALSEAKMTCVTEGEIQSMEKCPLAPAIDHICLDHRLAAMGNTVRGWLPERPLSGKPFSDHSGVYVHVAPL